MNLSEILSLASTIGPGGVGILAAIVVYLKITNQRKETKSERDEDYRLIEYRVSQLEQNQSTLAQSIKELQESIVSLQVSVNTLIIEIKNMKERI